MPQTERLWDGNRHVGKKGGVRQSEKVRCIIRHAVLLTQVVKYRRVQEKLSRVMRVDAEEVINHQVDHEVFARAPRDGGGVV